MNKSLGFCLLLAIAASKVIHAADTPETLLIRQVLNNDRFAMRRGIEHLDLALSGYADNFVVYAGNNTGDPRGWSLLHENKETFAAAHETNLKTNRFDFIRTVPHILVGDKKAIVTTIDSGQVIDRQNGTIRELNSQRLWIFRKIEEAWLATAIVQSLGDSLDGASQPSAEAPEIKKLLEREKAGWEDGSPTSIIGLFDEEFIGYDGKDKHRPASWSILFNNALEMEKWLNKRLSNTLYKINREILYATVGANGQEALAVTSERVSTAYGEIGPVTHERDRYVLWTMSRSSGSWKITNMLYNLGLDD